jgi:hypothetical protein
VRGDQIERHQISSKGSRRQIGFMVAFLVSLNRGCAPARSGPFPSRDDLTRYGPTVLCEEDLDEILLGGGARCRDRFRAALLES